MFPTLNPYPAYKPSGVDWLGDVPAHWVVRRIRDSVSDCIGGVWGSEPNGLEDLPCVRVADFDRQRFRVHMDNPTLRAITPNERRQRILNSGVLLLEKSGGGDLQPVGVVMLYDYNVPAVCSNFIARLRISVGFDPVFLTFLHATLYALRLNTRSIKQTTGIQNLDTSAYLRERVCIPPLPEQTAIARYLDHADRRIQRYIQAKEKRITLLHEARQAIIQRAVTRGLNPDVPLKPSGVEWLGDVPAHWEVRRLRYLIEGNLTYGANAAAEHDNPNWPRYLRITDFALDGTLRGDTFRSLPPEVARDYLVKPGDLLLARSGATVGKAFLVTSEVGQACHAGYLIRARPRNCLVEPRFLFAFTQSAMFTRWKDSTFIIATIPNISAEKYANLSVPTPPLEEQKQIAAYLNKATATIDTAINTARRQSEHMQEYRASLIAHVVTGKLDVRAAAERIGMATS